MKNLVENQTILYIINIKSVSKMELKLFVYRK